MSLPLHIVILAGGAGKRMFSQRPKALHTLAGKPLLMHVIETAAKLNPASIHVIYGHHGEELRKALVDVDVHWILQKEQLGTGHAVMQALPFMPEDAQVLILSADVPLIQPATLEALMQKSMPNSDVAGRLALLLAKLDDPSGLGRIVRNAEGEIIAIMEEKDASPEQKAIQEIYSGICCLPLQKLAEWLPQLNSDNAQQEYYLTDIIAIAVAEHVPVVSLLAENAFEIQGVNTRLQLQTLERTYQKYLAEQLMHQGVSILDAARIDIRGELICEQDVSIDINCIFIGKVILSEGVIIEPNCILNHVIVDAGSHIHANSVLEGCHIGPNCHIGPFARLRPGTDLAADCKIGNFVETKNSSFAEGSKANHLSYIGDTKIGKQVNIGAGCITCNYDGANKHETHIGDGAFIGSGTQLVAPVEVGTNATIGAGSTIRKNTPADQLTLSQKQQVTISGWKRPLKNTHSD